MIQKSIRGSILLYVILLVNIALIVGVVVFNNSFVVVNNIDIGNNQEEVFSNIYNKGNIAINSVVKYNSNGGGFLDGISCPTNVTMSGTTIKTTGISTHLVYKLGKAYCEGIYNGKIFTIFYDALVNDFKTSQFEGDMVNIIKTGTTNINISNTNIALTSTLTSTSPYSGFYSASKSIDSDILSRFISNYGSIDYLNYQFSGPEKSIGKIVIKKEYHAGNGTYWSNGILILKNSLGIEVDRIYLTGMRWQTNYVIDLKYRGLTADVKTIRLETTYRFLDVNEFEIYELLSSGNELWTGDRVFNDTDSTLISFTKAGIAGNDGIDDDLNSDNYKVTSIGNIYYPNNYQDDDVVPRLTVFGNIDAKSTNYQNIYWNNYKTVKYLSGNVNNNDTLNVKMGDEGNAYIYLDTFNTLPQDFDLKILEFDRNKYKDEFTLYIVNSNQGKNISNYLGYIQKDPITGVLSLSKGITGNEFNFDFKNKDYALFLKNNTDQNFSYQLSAETPTGSGIYINPIDDSGTGSIKVMVNHIIIGGEKNFIGENFEMVGPK